MTILPKKKQNSSKTTVAEHSNVETERENVVGNVSTHQHQPISNVGRNSPPRWPNTNHNLDDISAEGDEEYADLEVSSNSNGSSTNSTSPSSNQQHKRRHRASPHRNQSRKHRNLDNIRNNPSISNSTNSTGQIIPSIVSPSTSTSVNPSLNNSNNSNSDESMTVAALNNNDIAEDYSGYNSGDEYCQSYINARSEEEWDEVEMIFEKKLRKKGLIIKMMCQDGACLFRAVADQVYGDQEMHPIVRKHCMDYMAKNGDYFSQYVTEDFDNYVKRKRLNHIHGNHVEMQAMCELFNRSIEVFHYTTDAINTFHSMHSTDNEPIRISYHKRAHYNSIVDPYKATVGVGLGLPEMMPGLAEKNLMRDAVRVSEDFHIEQAMLEDKLKATDWEATSEAIEEQVARESYLQWLKDNERRHRKGSTRSATATCSSSSGVTSGGSSPMGGRSPRGRLSPAAGNSPSREQASSSITDISTEQSSSTSSALLLTNTFTDGTEAASSSSNFKDFSLSETATFINQLPPDVFGLSEWEDAGMIAQVLAASQQEYLDSLKRIAEIHQGEDVPISASTSTDESTSKIIKSADETVVLDENMGGTGN
ncbi:hypothetical protein CHUAL_013885 [Chamberlinius hualienensis]